MAVDPTSSQSFSWVAELIGNPKFSATVAISTLMLLVLPRRALQGLMADQIVARYGGAIGLVFVVATVAFLVEMVTSEHVRGWRQRRERAKRLRQLTEEEKAVLRRYIYGGTRTQYFDVSSGIAMGLVREGILFCPVQVGHAEKFAFNITPWTWDYLDKHRHLLDPAAR